MHLERGAPVSCGFLGRFPTHCRLNMLKKEVGGRLGNCALFFWFEAIGSFPFSLRFVLGGFAVFSVCTVFEFFVRGSRVCVFGLFFISFGFPCPFFWVCGRDLGFFFAPYACLGDRKYRRFVATRCVCPGWAAKFFGAEVFY